MSAFVGGLFVVWFFVCCLVGHLGFIFVCFVVLDGLSLLLCFLVWAFSFCWLFDWNAWVGVLGWGLRFVYFGVIFGVVKT